MDEKLKVSHRVELENLGSQFRQKMYQTTITFDNLGSSFSGSQSSPTLPAPPPMPLIKDLGFHHAPRPTPHQVAGTVEDDKKSFFE